MKYNEIFSTQELHARMHESTSNAPSLSTTYRSLEILLKEKLVQSVDLRDGERRYEFVRLGEHHHHLICRECNTNIHLEECSVEQFKDRIESEHGFLIRQHVMEIFGKCQVCLAKSIE